MDFKSALEKGHLQKAEPNEEFAEKEFEEARLDLLEAKDRLAARRYKWATVSAYYAIFHSAKAFLFARGFKERAHYAIGLALDEFAKVGVIDSRLANYFRAAMHARESADYHYDYSKETAVEVVSFAEEFVPEMRKAISRQGGKLK